MMCVIKSHIQQHHPHQLMHITAAAPYVIFTSAVCLRPLLTSSIMAYCTVGKLWVVYTSGRIYYLRKERPKGSPQWSPGENPGRESGDVPQKLKYFCLNHIFDISGSLVTNCIKHKRRLLKSCTAIQPVRRAEGSSIPLNAPLCVNI